MAIYKPKFDFNNGAETQQMYRRFADGYKAAAVAPAPTPGREMAPASPSYGTVNPPGRNRGVLPAPTEGQPGVGGAASPFDNMLTHAKTAAANKNKFVISAGVQGPPPADNTVTTKSFSGNSDDDGSTVGNLPGDGTGTEVVPPPATTGERPTTVESPGRTNEDETDLNKTPPPDPKDPFARYRRPDGTTDYNALASYYGGFEGYEYLANEPQTIEDYHQWANAKPGRAGVDIKDYLAAIGKNSPQGNAANFWAQYDSFTDSKKPDGSTDYDMLGRYYAHTGGEGYEYLAGRPDLVQEYHKWAWDPNVPEHERKDRQQLDFADYLAGMGFRSPKGDPNALRSLWSKWGHDGSGYLPGSGTRYTDGNGNTAINGGGNLNTDPGAGGGGGVAGDRSGTGTGAGGSETIGSNTVTASTTPGTGTYPDNGQGQAQISAMQNAIRERAMRDMAEQERKLRSAMALGRVQDSGSFDKGLSDFYSESYINLQNALAGLDYDLYNKNQDRLLAKYGIDVDASTSRYSADQQLRGAKYSAQAQASSAQAAAAAQAAASRYSDDIRYRLGMAGFDVDRERNAFSNWATQQEIAMAWLRTLGAYAPGTGLNNLPAGSVVIPNNLGR